MIITYISVFPLHSFCLRAGAYNSNNLFGDKGSTTYWIRPLKITFPTFVKITPIEIN